jgi:hypothetical protein
VGDVYKKAMGEYETAIQLEDEIKKALSLNDKASADTAIRKLLSITRNNVQTNYGTRIEMVKALEESGGADIIPKVAGISMNPIAPRGLGARSVATLNLASAPVTGGVPWQLGTLPFQSPRLVGEVAHTTGKASRISDFIKAKMKNVGITPDRARKTIQAAVQAGRIDRETAQMALDEIDLINKG